MQRLIKVLEKSIEEYVYDHRAKKDCKKKSKSTIYFLKMTSWTFLNEETCTSKDSI